MKTKCLILILLAGASLCHAEEKPVVYNHITKEGTVWDGPSHAALGKKFTITDIPEDADYVPPKVTEGSLPRVARTPEGEALGGDVVVAYAISTDGRAIEPAVLKTSDERLNRFATKAMEGWRFTPATYDGKPVSTTAVQEFSFQGTPTEFVTQVLEPTGGKVERPKDWHYAEQQRSSGYLWTISREKMEEGKSYTTGLRIQVLVGVEKGTGKTAKPFIYDFIEKKKKEADKVIETCGETVQDNGLFTRTCLEIEEGPRHILFSLFWGTNGMDMAVIVTAGTTKELWEVYAPAFAKMSGFELIDMKRFEK